MSKKSFIVCDYCHAQVELKDSNKALGELVRVLFVGIGLELDFCCVAHAQQALKIRGSAPEQPKAD